MVDPRDQVVPFKTSLMHGNCKACETKSIFSKSDASKLKKALTVILDLEDALFCIIN